MAKSTYKSSTDQNSEHLTFGYRLLPYRSDEPRQIRGRYCLANIHCKLEKYHRPSVPTAQLCDTKDKLPKTKRGIHNFHRYDVHVLTERRKVMIGWRDGHYAEALGIL